MSIVVDSSGMVMRSVEQGDVSDVRSGPHRRTGIHSNRNSDSTRRVGIASARPATFFVHHNPPGKTLEISLSTGESVAFSVSHRLWCANLGWTVARELRTGDVLRTLGGRVQVPKVESEATVLARF
jgi:hypothetical protein